jgi:phage repressor protein C with HTH and peptisase S24 domain
MARPLAANKPAKYSVLQLALPSEAPRNIGIFLLDTATGRLYKKLRRDWSAIADPESVEILQHLDEDFEVKIDEMGGDVFLRSLENSLSNFLLIDERQDVSVVSDFETALNRLFEEHVQRTEIIEFVTHVPLYSLRAAATKFGEDMEVEVEDWVRAPERLKLDRNMFACHVVGQSMEPVIPDGSLCLFRGSVVGSRQNKRLLIQRMGVTDSSAEFTVKKYTSKKKEHPDEDQLRNLSILLSPLNPEFEAMEFGPEDEHRQFRVVAEFLQVLEESV